jgi:hypothetical protein
MNDYEDPKKDYVYEDNDSTKYDYTASYQDGDTVTSDSLVETDTTADLNDYNTEYTNDDIRNSLDSSSGEDLNN